MAGIALATFADRPSAKKSLRERKTLSCGRPLLGVPGFVQQAARNYSKSQRIAQPDRHSLLQ
jgi:hypothetical protein